MKDKLLTNKTIIVIPGATQEQLMQFRDVLIKSYDKKDILYNKDMKLFKIIKGETYEVVSRLKKVKKCAI